MIKLNNKNITYVAFADSSNSIKAPKEIWYADSSNSVKLVYRRKDTLIEGEDYEKYHWLEGDGSAYIDTLITDLSVSDYIKTIFDDSSNIGVSIRTWGREGNRLVVGNDGSSTSLKVWGTSSSFAYNNDGIYIYDMYFDLLNDKVTVNNQIFTLSLPHDNGISFLLFARHFNTSPSRVDSINWAKYKSFEIHNQIKLIPCKLLKPVPKWLDANGIRRQVGECGMIDLVSGKFYGNVNSVGTFTVENYYERKEWLVGDGSAYIDTGHNVNEDLDYETKAHLLPHTYLFWYRSGSPYRDQTMVARSNTTITGTRIAKNSNDTNIGDIANVEVQWNGNEVSINGVNYIPVYRELTFSYGLYLFYAHLADTSVHDYSSNDVKCAYFRFLDSNRDYIQNLIPCTLTMDLPASMDANNIARTKGTSGMWDLVSDRFYGNVANSGTFKAVNLAEGVDYEVHQWLGSASGFPYIKVQDGVNTDENAYIETTYKCNYSNGGFDMVVGFSVNQNNNIGIRIFNSAYGTFVDYHKTENGVLSSSRIIKSQSNINAERYIKATLNNLIIDDTEYPTINWDSGFDAMNRRETILYTNQGYNDVHYAETKLRVNNVEYDLIPVKLLKSIPSKYDANGIARQAGECGMYDTVNDVFYGNVASSGTFSVSDDS